MEGNDISINNNNDNIIDEDNEDETEEQEMNENNNDNNISDNNEETFTINDSIDYNRPSQQKKLQKQLEKIQKKIEHLCDLRDKILLKIDDKKIRAKLKKQSFISSNPDKIKVNIIDFMKKGTSLLKYGRRGAPHFRHFEINNLYLIWYSNNKNIEKTRILLKNIIKIQAGQLTDNFKKYLQPKLSSCSFSVIYGENKQNYKTLDVIAINKYDYNCWFDGLNYVIKYFENNPNMNEFNNIKPVYTRVLQRNQKSIEKKINLQPSPGIKTVQKDLDNVSKKYSKLTRMSNELPQRRESMHVKERLGELEQDMERLRDLFHKKSGGVTAHEIWRTSVELKTLENKMNAISKMK